MPTWNVTGKMGGGKTLYAVDMMFRYLREGRRVATNIDLFPEKVLDPWNDTCSLIRLPDIPSRQDLNALGVGNPTSDESRNGLIVFDECGGFLNARTYQDKGREKFLSFLRHSRKRGWDIVLISQSYSMLDKQVRDAVVEYLVQVRRMDRFKVPLLNALGFPLKLPRVHFAIERYGTTPTAPVSDRTFFRGGGLFDAYSTRQSIEVSEDEDVPEEVESLGEAGSYSVLPPWHTKGRFMRVQTLLFHATKGAIVAGCLIGASVTWVYLTSKHNAVAQIVKKDVEQLQGVMLNKDGTVLVVRSDGRTQTVSTYTVKDQFITVDLGAVEGRAPLLR